MAQLGGADRRRTGDEYQLVGRRKLHHFTWCQQGASGLLPADHDVREPWRDPVARIVAHGALLGGGAAGIGDARRRPLVICRGGHEDMALAEVREVRRALVPTPVTNSHYVCTLL